MTVRPLSNPAASDEDEHVARLRRAMDALQVELNSVEQGAHWLIKPPTREAYRRYILAVRHSRMAPQ